jgi:hypothetical protein
MRKVQGLWDYSPRMMRRASWKDCVLRAIASTDYDPNRPPIPRYSIQSWRNGGEMEMGTSGRPPPYPRFSSASNAFSLRGGDYG